MPDSVIKKVKLSNGQYYSFFDTGALRLNAQNKLITGNSTVDQLIIDGNLYITEIDDVPVEDEITNVLVQSPLTGEIKKRSVDYLLEDIGGISYTMDEEEGTLGFDIGKKNN